MATPTENSVPASGFSPTLADEGRFVTRGLKWGEGFGEGVTVTFSFPGRNPTFDPDYGDDVVDTASPLTGNEKTAVRTALSEWSKIADISFVETPDNATTVGELRFADSREPEGVVFGFFPFTTPRGGDVWFNASSFNDDPTSRVETGSFDHLTVLRATAFSIGLTTTGNSTANVPNRIDTLFNTVMADKASKFNPDGNLFASFYPTTPMYYDYLAVQAIYGANLKHNTGNNTYTFRNGQQYFETIYDTGGNDRIVYRGPDDIKIDLNPGEFSSLSEPITFFNSNTSRETVTIGPGVRIENATGGSGDDNLIGNNGNNRLEGLRGDDRLAGSDGRDRLLGGDDNDRLIGGRDNDRLVGGNGNDRLNGGSNNDVLLGGNGNDRLLGDSGNDVLRGGNGNDRLVGRNGDDLLVGGRGKDVMAGGPGRDRFDFNKRNESGTGSDADDISGFQRGDDDIDLSSIIGPKLRFIGEKSFNGSGRQVRIEDKGKNVTVEVDINGDRAPDMEIDVLGVGTLRAGDFLL